MPIWLHLFILSLFFSFILSYCNSSYISWWCSWTLNTWTDISSEASRCLSHHTFARLHLIISLFSSFIFSSWNSSYISRWCSWIPHTLTAISLEASRRLLITPLHAFTSSFHYSLPSSSLTAIVATSQGDVMEYCKPGTTLEASRCISYHTSQLLRRSGGRRLLAWPPRCVRLPSPRCRGMRQNQFFITLVTSYSYCS